MSTNVLLSHYAFSISNQRAQWRQLCADKGYGIIVQHAHAADWPLATGGTPEAPTSSLQKRQKFWLAC